MDWALVLSGGGARGLAHIGILEVLEQYAVNPPALVVGCSMGAVIGGLYAAGVTTAEMREFLSPPFSPTDILDDSVHTLFKGPITKAVQIGRGLVNVFTAGGIDSGKKMRDLIADMTDDARFDTLQIPFICNATDLVSGEEIVLGEGDLADAIRASASFPGVFTPVPREGQLLADGYMCSNTPVWIARKAGIRNVLAVKLDEFSSFPAARRKTSFDILLRGMDCAIHRMPVPRRNTATASILANNDRQPFDFENPLEQVDFGYTAAMNQTQILEDFFSTGITGYSKRRHLARHERKRSKQ